MIKPREDVAALAAYALADLSAPPGERTIQLAQNESPYRPSPKAIKEATAALEVGNLYPDTECSALRTRIATDMGVPGRLRILCGAGLMELISALIRAYAGPGDEVLAPAHGYGFFRTVTAIAGADFVTAPEDETLTVSVDALLAAVTPRTRLVCIANPGNPTGTVLSGDEIMRLREGLPEDVLLLLDQAYAEFSAEQDQLLGLPFVGNTVISRTFSKAYNLAGMRVGWMVVPGGVEGQMRKLLTPNSVTAVAQAAALGAMRDGDYTRDCLARIAATRAWFTKRVRNMGLRTTDSHANFVLIRFADAAEATRAEQALRAKGVLTRPQAGHGLPECLRITVGLDADMELAADVLASWVEGGRP